MKDVPTFLWLGNIDTFKSMVEEEEDGLEKFVPGCNVGKDGNKAVDFIVEKYLQGVTDRKKVFVSFLDVIDVRSVKKAVGEVGEVMLTLNAKGVLASS